MSVTVRAAAKVNLYLGVGALRPDGFHELATVFQSVSLFDDVTVEAADKLSVHVEGEGARFVPADEHNLAARAARALAERYQREPAVRIVIRKGIPVAGGMAGGSADAAAALVGCDALWQLRAEPAGLAELAAELGSDVPFCLVGGSALAAGRGERLIPVLARGEYHWVFALADSGLSTPAVYAELDRMRGDAVVADPAVPDDVLAALRSGEPRRLARAVANDLQQPALRLRPALRRTLDAGLEAGALAGLVCGSGPTCAFLAADEPAAIDLTAVLAGSGACRAVRRAHGPVPGARVLP